VFEEIDEYVPRVYRFALRLTQSADSAEDLTQETFLRAWKHRARLRDARSVLVWLFRIANNVWRDQVRRDRTSRWQELVLNEEPISAEFPVERELESRDELRLALEALDSLPARQREALYLRACEGLSLEEIADVLGITPDAVKASVSLARKKIREQLGRRHNSNTTALERRPE
jgi:RNA polymerase sigma-70 factor (ECF subfamily)